jgi:hypothetical protein
MRFFRLIPVFLLALIMMLAAGTDGADAAEASVPSRHVIEGIAWIPQTWNNCGPATLAMALDRWGVPATQQEIADLIRPNDRDGHVALDQIASAASSRGMKLLFIPSGNLDLVKIFVANGFPVMMPTWHIDEGGSQMGHYRLVHGYDDELGSFFLRDSLEPVGYGMDYTTFDALWRVFNRRMLVVYPAGRSDDAARIARSAGFDAGMLEDSLAREALDSEPPEVLPEGMSPAHYRAYSDYNRAMALTALGRYAEASEAVLAAFDRGLPWRMLWYQPEVLESLYRTGEYSRIIAETTGGAQSLSLPRRALVLARSCGKGPGAGGGRRFLLPARPGYPSGMGVGGPRAAGRRLNRRRPRYVDRKNDRSR